MNELELLAAKALRLLKEVDEVLVVDVIRLNDIELSIFEQGLIYELQSLYKENADLIRRYERQKFANAKSTDEYLQEVKQKKRKAKND